MILDTSFVCFFALIRDSKQGFLAQIERLSIYASCMILRDESNSLSLGIALNFFGVIVAKADFF